MPCGVRAGVERQGRGAPPQGACQMILTITAHLDYALAAPADMLLQIEAAPMPGQTLLEAGIGLSPVDHFARVRGEDGIGDRIWLAVADRLTCDYRSVVRIDRATPPLASLAAVPLHRLPGEAVGYLMASRYCPADEFQSFVAAEFGTYDGGAKVAAMRDWIERAFTYVPGASTAQTTALDTFVQRQGICRDYAHVLITLARAAAIPARIASVYAPGVTPMDFHAVAEVYLDGGWHLADATGMASAEAMAIIGVGRDAADVSLLTSYGPAEMLVQKVTVAILVSG